MKTAIKNPIIVVLLLLFSLNLQAQNHKIDSLKNVLKTAKEDTNKVNTLHALCKNFFYGYNYDSAFIYQKIALELAEKLDFKRAIAFGYSGLGKIYDSFGNAPEALKYYHIALKRYEYIGDKNRIGMNYFNIGNLYYAQKNYTEALKYLKTGLKLTIEIGNKEGEINYHTMIGGCYSEQGKYKEALDNYNIALKKSQEINNEYYISLTYSNIGDIYLQTGNYSECLKYQFLAIKIAEKTDFKDIMAQPNLNIGICYRNLKQLDKAERFCLNSLKLAKEFYITNLIIISQKELSDIYTEKGDVKKAFAYYKDYVASRDSFINAEKTKKTLTLEMNYQFEKKEAVTKLEQDKKDAVQTAILTSVVFGLIVAIALSFVAYRSYKRKQKDNVLLEKQKSELNEKNKIIDDKQKELLASIRYAKRIQMSLITSENYIEKSLNSLIKN